MLLEYTQYTFMIFLEHSENLHVLCGFLFAFVDYNESAMFTCSVLFSLEIHTRIIFWTSTQKISYITTTDQTFQIYNVSMYTFSIKKCIEFTILYNFVTSRFFI